MPLNTIDVLLQWCHSDECASWIQVVHPVQCFDLVLGWATAVRHRSTVGQRNEEATHALHEVCLKSLLSSMATVLWQSHSCWSDSCCYTKPSSFPRWLSSAASLVSWFPWRYFFGDWNHFSYGFPRQIGELSMFVFMWIDDVEKLPKTPRNKTGNQRKSSCHTIYTDKMG